MAIIQSGSSSDLLTIDAVSKAARVTLYDSNGNNLIGLGAISSLNQVLNSLNQTVSLDLLGKSNAAVQILGTTGIINIAFEATIDQTNWFSVNGINFNDSTSASSTTVDGIWFINISGFYATRVKVASISGGSTTASIIIVSGDRSLAITSIAGEGADNANNSTTKVPVLAARANTSSPSWTDGHMAPLSVDTSGNLRVTGTVIETNASITTIGSSSPGSATNVGGNVTSSNPSYSAGTFEGLSLTTAGALRVDNSGVTQPVSGTGTFTVVQATASNLNAAITAAALPLPAGASTEASLSTRLADSTFTGRINTLGQKTSSNSTPVTIASDQSSIPAAQSGSWTVTSNIGTSGSLALDATLTGGTQRSKITDGANNAAVKAASIAAIATDPSLVVSISPNNSVAITAASLPLPSGATTETTLGTRLADSTFTGRINTLGQKTMANSTPIVLASDQSAISVLGSVAIGAAITGSPVLAGFSDGANVRYGLSDTSGRLVIQGAIADKTSMTAGSQAGVPIIGQSYGVGRIISTNRFGNSTPGYQTLLACDPIEGSTINTWLWTQSTTTMTIAQSTGLLTLNNGAITTTTTDAIITTNKQFPIISQAAIACSYRALISQTTNSTQEIGFGAPVGTTAIINNGAFFRIQNSGQVKVVTSYNGTETVSGILATLVSTSYYLFIIQMNDNGARFIIEDSNGIPLLDTSGLLTITTPDKAAVTHIPSFARVYTTGAAGAAPQTKISSFQAYQFDLNTTKMWGHQVASTGRDSGISPTAFTQTTQLANGAAPAAFTPSNTVAGNATLGGEAAVNLSVTNENLLSVFAFTVPSPYTLMFDSCVIPAPVVTTATTVTATILEWVLIYNASSGNLSTATGQIRRSLGFHTAAASAAAGTMFTGSPIVWAPQTPIACLPGTVVHLAVKVILGAATGVYRASWNAGGYYE